MAWPMIETAAGLLNPVRVSADILKALAARATEALARRAGWCRYHRSGVL